MHRGRRVLGVLLLGLLIAACSGPAGGGGGGGAATGLTVRVRVPSTLPGGQGQCDGPINVYLADASAAVVASETGGQIAGGQLDVSLGGAAAGSYWILVQSVPLPQKPGAGECQGVSGGLYVDQWEMVSHGSGGSSHTVLTSRLAARSGAIAVAPQQLASARLLALGAASETGGESVPGEVIVKFRSSTGAPGTTSGPAPSRASPAAITPAGPAPARVDLGPAGELMLSRILGNGAGLYRAGGGADGRLLAAILVARADVEYAEPNFVRRALATPNDAYYSYQWHYPAMFLDYAWDVTVGGAAGDAPVTRPRIAVLDTGHTAHDDLPAAFAQCDFVDRDGIAIDLGPDSATFWHGTHVAGTVGAVTGNASGVAGVVWNAQLIHGRVLGPHGGSTADIVDGILWAAGVANPVGACPALSVTDAATVINLSLGGQGYSRTEQEAINLASLHGALVVAAAGNEDDDAGNHSPARLDNVVTVAALNSSGARAYYSNYGDSVDLAAPGGEASDNFDPYGILSTIAPNDYAFYQGTSMAAPHVAGVAALVQHVQGIFWNSRLFPWEMQALLAASSSLSGVSCPPPKTCGAGLLDAYAAVTQSTWPISVEADKLTLAFTDATPAGDAARKFTVTNVSGASLTFDLSTSHSDLSVSPSGPVTLASGAAQTFEASVADQSENATYYGRITLLSSVFQLEVTVYFGETSGSNADDYNSALVLALEAADSAAQHVTGVWREDSIPAGALLPGGTRAWSIPSTGQPGVIPTAEPVFLGHAYAGTDLTGPSISGGGALPGPITPSSSSTVPTLELKAESSAATGGGGQDTLAAATRRALANLAALAGVWRQ